MSGLMAGAVPGGQTKVCRLTGLTGESGRLIEENGRLTEEETGRTVSLTEETVRLTGSGAVMAIWPRVGVVMVT